MSGVDVTTGELSGDEPLTSLEREKARVERLEADLAILMEDLIREKRMVASLKGQLAKQSGGGQSHTRVANAVAAYYRERLGKNKGWRFGERRQKVVLARLREDYDGVYIARAIDGLAVGAFTNGKGVRYDDLELVCRDETKLERFHQTAENATAATHLDEDWEAVLRGQEPPTRDPMSGV